MFKHYLMTTLRNLLKYKTHSVLTILGLAVGFAASAIIFIVNYTELNYDNHWADADRIYQVEAIVKYNAQATKRPIVPAVFYELLKTQAPEIQEVTRWSATGTKVRYASGTTEENTFEERMASVDDSFFDIFNFPVSAGNLKDFYTDNSSVIISVDLATKLFGNDNPIGKIVTIDVTNVNNAPINASGSNAREQKKKNYKVVSVISNRLHKSSIPSPNLYIHIENNKLMEISKEGNISHSFTYSYQLYIKTKKNIDIAKLTKSLPAIQDRFISGKIEISDKKPSEFFDISFLNIKDTHLKGSQARGQIEQIWMLFGLAILILLMACINYINLALAAYPRRHKEIALRKTMGASKRDVVFQFLTEALSLTTFSLFIALIIVEISIPWLKDSLNLDIESGYIYQPELISYLFVMACFIGLLCGTYPSLYLSRFNPAVVLKSNKSIESPRSIKFRQALVICQFVISGIMLCCTSVIAAQMYKIRHYNPGYQTEKIIFAIHEGLGGANMGDISTLKHKISKIPGINSVELSMPSIPGKDNSQIQVSRQANDSAPITLALQQVNLAGPKDLEVFNVELISGKYFSPSIDPDKGMFGLQDKIYINQQALTPLGFKNPNDAINQKIDIDLGGTAKVPMTIVGVTKRVHVGSLNAPDAPCFFWPLSSTGLPIALAVRYDNISRNQASDQIKSIWKEVLGYTPHTWFIEDALADEYKNENMIARFVYMFTGIAIFISCLGLYGLATHATNKRKKEIGLRKVHGASVFNIVRLLLWQFNKPVLFANVIIWPIALYAGSRWLEQFVNRIDIWLWGPVFCLCSALLAILIACLTVGGHAFIVAREKPVAALREE